MRAGKASRMHIILTPQTRADALKERIQAVGWLLELTQRVARGEYRHMRVTVDLRDPPVRTGEELLTAMEPFRGKGAGPKRKPPHRG